MGLNSAETKEIQNCEVIRPGNICVKWCDAQSGDVGVDDMPSQSQGICLRYPPKVIIVSESAMWKDTISVVNESGRRDPNPVAQGCDSPRESMELMYVEA